MKLEILGEILAVVALQPEKVGGGAPVFFAQDRQELAALAFLLARILGGAVHDLQNEVYIVVRH